MTPLWEGGARMVLVDAIVVSSGKSSGWMVM
jgi:hypothetical protein